MAGPISFWGKVVLAWTAGAVAVRAASDSMQDPGGPQAAHIDGLWQLMLWVCTGVFFIVMIAVGLALTRAPAGEEAEPPPNDTGRRVTRVIAGGAIVTAVVLFVFLVASISTSRALTRLQSPGARTIAIDGRQWWWQVRYLDAQPSNEVTTANEIHIPVGQPVHLRLTASDVIHSFWVPSLHGKRDLIPGHTTHLWLQADRAGVFDGQCAEFCGFQHAHMGLRVIAEPPEVFEAWLDAQRRPAREPRNEAQRRGRDVFLSSSCIMCHTVRGTGAGGRPGPDLTHLASRQTLAAIMIPNTRGHLAGWILDPQGVKPGTKMPANAIAPADLHPLLDYLTSLQ